MKPGLPSAAWIKVIIAALAGIMLLLSTVTGDSIDKQGLRWLGAAISAITLGVLAWDRWAWRWPVIRLANRWVGPPLLHGTWHGELAYESDEQGEAGVTDFYMSVRQQFSSLSIQSYFPRTDSVSDSLTATLSEGPQRWLLHFTYSSRAAPVNQDTNRPHEGACTLAVVGRPIADLSGSYYTDRKGRGTIRFHGHTRKLAGSLAVAKGLEYDPVPRAARDRWWRRFCAKVA
ncbi:MAG: hypothetical protein WB797_04540 [Nocardioides sp.]